MALRVNPNSSSPPPSRLGGCLTRRERWGLSGRGALVLLLLALAGAGVFWRGVHPFLALTNKVEAEVLIVEGWVGQRAISMAVQEFESAGYEAVFTTGGPTGDGSPYTSKYDTYAHFAFARLQNAGLPREVLTRVPARQHDRDRTYSSALALRHWFESREKPLPTRINVLTDDVHARRTRLLFRRAFGPEVAVGVIAAPPSGYSAERWWQYSLGTKTVISETAAYLHARLLFRPDPRKTPPDFAAPD